MNKYLRSILIIFVILLILLVLFVRLKSNSSNQIFTPIPTPTQSPIPFAEMTIPYLSSREYKSSLSELKKYEDHSLYTSYLTSYSSDNLKINGLLTIPKNDKSKHPAIIFVHGYIAPTIYKTTERYEAYVDYLAKNGFVVFKIDLRGNGSSEGLPSGAYYSSDYVVDTLNAYEALKKSDFVDASKIGLWGHSMAGNIVMRAFVSKPTIPAVVVWAGAGYTYTDLLTYKLNDRSYRPQPADTEVVRKRQRLTETYGAFDERSSFWSQVAVTNYLQGLKGALQIHHAKDDSVVNIEYSRNLIRLLDNTQVSHTLYEYQSGGHNISGASFNLAMGRTVEFFKKYL